MPELAELRLTADYINACSQGDGPHIHYISIEKNPAHKGTHCITPENPGEYFSLSAKSRGKELLIYIHKDNNITPIRMTMGMSGHFELTNTGQESKHAHLKFYRKDGTTLSFVDVRRFGKWKASETWSINRGPDPVFDHTEFIDNIYKNIGLIKGATQKKLLESKEQAYMSKELVTLRDDVLEDFDFEEYLMDVEHPFLNIYDE